MATINEFQAAAEERDLAARDVLMTKLVTKKNTLWKEISWSTRKQEMHSSSKYQNQYAQVDSVVPYDPYVTYGEPEPKPTPSYTGYKKWQ